MADYPPYSGDDATCPKCTIGSMAADYQPCGTGFGGQDLIFRRPEDHSEWMLRRCRNCGFELPERCADATPEATGD